MDRSDTIGKDAKYHVHNEDKRFLGTLCCKAEDVVRTGAVLRGELYIKRLKPFDTRTAEKRHQKLPMFLQRKEKFASQREREAFNMMLNGFRVFLEDLHHDRKCAVLSDNVVLALGEETYGASALPQEPAIFLHVPSHLPPSHLPPSHPPPSHLPPSPRAPPPALRASEGGRRAVPAATTPRRKKRGRRVVRFASASSPPLGLGSPDHLLRPRDPVVPSGDAGAGVGRGRGTESYAPFAGRAPSAGEDAWYNSQTSTAPQRSRPPKHMMMLAQQLGPATLLTQGWQEDMPPGWIGTNHGDAWGAHSSSLSPRTSQPGGRAWRSPGAGVGRGDRAVGNTSRRPRASLPPSASRANGQAWMGPGGGVAGATSRRRISQGGRGGGGARGEGRGSPPTPTKVSPTILPPDTSQTNGQASENPGAGVGRRNRTVGDTYRHHIPLRGRGGGGASGEGTDSPPAPIKVSPAALPPGASQTYDNAGENPGAGAGGRNRTVGDTYRHHISLEGRGGGGASGEGTDSPPAPTKVSPAALPPGASQTNGQASEIPGASAGGRNRTVGDTYRRQNTSRGGRRVGGASGEGIDIPPTPTDTLSSRIGVGNDSIPRKKSTPGSEGCSGDGGRDGDEGGSGAAQNEQGGAGGRSLRRTSSMNDSFFINLADKRHTWAFGAVAELIHNSSDAKATEVRVSLEHLGPQNDTNFVVVDNGHGITHEAMAQLFTVGKDYGRGPSVPAGERIGCNGVGFKQGVLRLGNTAVVVSVRGKVPAPDSPPEDIPTASFGILSIQPYRRSLGAEREREPVVVEYATLNLLTMQADERHNSDEEYETAMGVIRSLVPYFTKEYLVAYVARFVPHADGSAWKICDVKSSTSLFVSGLRKSPNQDGPNKFELIEDIGGADIRLEDRKGNPARLPHRPRSCNKSGKLWPPMDHSLRSFCELIFLDPAGMKIFVQGSEVEAGGIMSFLEAKETFGVDIFDFLEKDETADSVRDGRISSSGSHGPSPPYNIAVHVGQDRWHRENDLSGIMVYFENCLVDSYARGQGLPDVVQEKELGFLAIVSFSGPSDKRLFHPNPTKVGFPPDNDRYIHVLEAAGEALTQVVQNVHVPDETPLAENEEVDNWIECYRCGKSRKVSKEYLEQNEASSTWHCGIEGSPVPLPEEGSNKCHAEEDMNFGRTVQYKPSAPVSLAAEPPREVLPWDFIITKANLLGAGSSASVFAGCGYEGKNSALKVFTDEVSWKNEKDILWALEKAPGRSHPNICSLAWVCREELTLALRPLFPGSCSLSQCMHSNESHHALTNHVRLSIAEKVADALHHLHKRELCHNDVQPSNIVLGRNPKEDVLLVDFGQACKFSGTFHSSSTTLRYAPPEVLDGGAVPTRGERDIFGFGATMVELFAGQALFGSDVGKLQESLRRLKGHGDLRRVRFEDLKETLPGLKALHAKDGMKLLARICRSCVNGDTSLRLKSKTVVEALAKFRGSVDFHWRHGTNVVYHTLEPGDRLHISGDGVFLGLTRLPRPSGKVSIKDHIKHGSAFEYRSQYISCSLALAFCVFYAQTQHTKFVEEGFGLAPILEIDVSKLGCSDLGKHVFDGTKQKREGKETVLEPTAESFVGDPEEVILDAIAVPSAAVTAVWSLDFTQLTRESPTNFLERAGQLQQLHNALFPHASGRSPTFSKWEKHFEKFIRQKRDGEVSSLDLVKKQARNPNLGKGRAEDVLRASYCARRYGVEGVWPGGVVGVERSSRGARGGGGSSGRVGGARSGIEDGTSVTGGGAKGAKRGQPEGVQLRSNPPKSARVSM